MSAADLPRVHADGFVPVDVRDVEKELHRQLMAEQDPGGPPIQRARLSNLVIYCDDPARADAIIDLVPGIVDTHPARVLLLAAEPEAAEASGPSAAVRVRTRYARGNQEIGSELVVLRAGGRAVEHLPYIVRGLLIGDLPTNIWWAAGQPPPLAGPILHDLAERAQQVLYDSQGWTTPARGIAATASWLERIDRAAAEAHLYRIASDLVWRRLKPWRRLLAQALDPTTAPGTLESVADVLVEHGPHSVTSAWTLTAWLAHGLGWTPTGARVRPGSEVLWQLTSAAGPRQIRIARLGDREPGLHRVKIACSIGGGPCALDLTPEPDGQRLSIVPQGLDASPRTVSLATPPTPELIGRQLSDRERDPVFRQTMTYAQALAQRVLGMA